MTSLFPDICTDDLAGSRDFHRDLFGFEVIFENEWYVQMHHPKQPAAQIALVLRGHDTHEAVREIYLNDPHEVAEEALETEVLLPIGE